MTTGLDSTTETQVEWRLGVDDRVSLRPEVSDIYAMAPAYSEGWVRSRRIDTFGNYRMVFIEWDSSHWTYNGQPDMWTFEDHFDKVESKMTDETPDKSQIANALDILGQALGMDKAEQEPTQKEVGEQRAEEVTPDRTKQYEEVLNRAIEAARDGDAFVIGVVQKSDPPDGVAGDAKFVLIPSLYSYSMSPESAVFLDANLQEVIAESHQQLAVSEIRRLLKKKDQDETQS